MVYFVFIFKYLLTIIIIIFTLILLYYHHHHWQPSILYCLVSTPSLPHLPPSAHILTLSNSSTRPPEVYCWVKKLQLPPLSSRCINSLHYYCFSLCQLFQAAICCHAMSGVFNHKQIITSSSFSPFSSPTHPWAPPTCNAARYLATSSNTWSIFWVPSYMTVQYISFWPSIYSFKMI